MAERAQATAGVAPAAPGGSSPCDSRHSLCDHQHDGDEEQQVVVPSWNSKKIQPIAHATKMMMPRKPRTPMRPSICTSLLHAG